LGQAGQSRAQKLGNNRSGGPILDWMAGRQAEVNPPAGTKGFAASHARGQTGAVTSQHRAGDEDIVPPLPEGGMSASQPAISPRTRSRKLSWRGLEDARAHEWGDKQTLQEGLGLDQHHYRVNVKTRHDENDEGVREAFEATPRPIRDAREQTRSESRSLDFGELACAATSWGLDRAS